MKHHTKGAVKVRSYGDGQYSIYTNDTGYEEKELSQQEDIANATLIAEAFNVANETGLSPVELMEQNRELLTALKKLYNAIDSSVELTPELLRECGKLINKTKENLTQTL